MHHRCFLAEQEGRDLRRELLHRDMLGLGSKSVCGESPDPPPKPVADYTPESPGIRPHPTGVACNFHRLFRGSSKGKEEVGDPAPSHKEDKAEEEEDTIERIIYTTSNPPSNGE